MAKTLRAHQKQVARDLILEAFADEIVERGVADVSLQAVADRAGMSHRTLYNYFESREVLVDALVARLDESSSAPGIADTMGDLDRVPDAIRHYYSNWSAQGNVAKAVAQIAMATVAGGGDEVLRARDDKLDAVRDAILAERPDLDPAIAAAVAQVMRTFGSSRTWHRMTAEHGIEPGLAADAAAWAWVTLRDALKRGESPGQAPASGA